MIAVSAVKSSLAFESEVKVWYPVPVVFCFVSDFDMTEIKVTIIKINLVSI